MESKLGIDTLPEQPYYKTMSSEFNKNMEELADWHPEPKSAPEVELPVSTESQEATPTQAADAVLEAPANRNLIYNAIPNLKREVMTRGEKVAMGGMGASLLTLLTGDNMGDGRVIVAALALGAASIASKTKLASRRLAQPKWTTEITDQPEEGQGS